MATVLLAVLALRFLPVLGDQGAEECLLQIHGFTTSGQLDLGPTGPSPPPSPSSPPSPFEVMQKPWTDKGIHFPQCPGPQGPPGSPQPQAQGAQPWPVLLAEPQMPLPPKKPQCPPGSTLIGDFHEASYSYTCCDAGQQCGGCSSVIDGKCARCAAGYVKQTIPIIDKTKCFLCDDVAGWKDAAGRSCEDYAAVCNGSWPEPSLDVAFGKLRPSEACCACGGGSLYPTPVDLPLSSAVLYNNQKVDQACSLAGLELSTTGRINGTVTEALQCSITFIQDPIRGISFPVSLDVTVSEFSYGSPVLMFKAAWGLDDIEAAEATKNPRRGTTAELSDFELACDPACSWLSIDAKTGELKSGRNAWTQQGLPPDMWGAVQGLKGGTSECETVQAGSYDGDVEAEVGSPIVPVQLREALGPGLRWYKRPGHQLSAPVIQDAEGRSFVVPAAVASCPQMSASAFPGALSGLGRFVEVPSILDVRCTAPGVKLTWSRITGDVSFAGEVAFNLDPDSGSVSGTPGLGLMQAAGRARLDVSCLVALGGPFWARVPAVLPVATINIQLLDNVCWVPGHLHFQLHWHKFSCDQLTASALQQSMGSEVASHRRRRRHEHRRRREHPKHPCNNSHAYHSCLQQCRETPSCSAVYLADGECWVQASNGKHVEQKDDKEGRMLDFSSDESYCAHFVHIEHLRAERDQPVEPRLLIRVDNCSQKTADLLLEAPQAQLVAGIYSPSDDYHNSVSYSRAGVWEWKPRLCQNANWFLLLPLPYILFTSPAHANDVHRSLPRQCEGSHWLLAHANSSDFTSSATVPQYYGEVMACIQGDVVNETFDHGVANFSLEFLHAVVDDPMQFERPAAKQEANLSISAPSCSKPQSSSELLYGSVQASQLYSLSACECFGEAYASTDPVDPDSNAAVPRNVDRAFNVNPLKDQLIFTGPYTCEENAGDSAEAVMSTIQGFELQECKQACHEQDGQCRFYLFEKASQVCSLFSACDAMQYVGLDLSNELWGLAGVGEYARDYCRIADPQGCWEDVLRRRYLSPEPSDLPRCAFQAQLEACDALQLLSGEASGTCTRCEYLPADLSEVKASMEKIPLPEEFPAGSQIQVSCNATSRMFAGVLGPLPSTVFTCVGGDWVGEGWQDLENLTCQQCVQVGTESLQRLTNVSQGAAYLLAQRRIQATYGSSIPGCESASLPTAANLVSMVTGRTLQVEKDRNVILASPRQGTLWWIDAETGTLRLKSPLLMGGSWCLCFHHTLEACKCEPENGWTLDGLGRLSNQRSQCVWEQNCTAQVVTCPQDLQTGNRWYFDGGNCVLKMAMVDTAELTWNVSVEAGSSLLLAEITQDLTGIGSFRIHNDKFPEYSLSVQPDGAVVASYKSDFPWLKQGRKILYSDLGIDKYLLGLNNGSLRLGNATQANGFEGQWTCDQDNVLMRAAHLGPSGCIQGPILSCINLLPYEKRYLYAPVATPYQTYCKDGQCLAGPAVFELECPGPSGFLRGWRSPYEKNGNRLEWKFINFDCLVWPNECLDHSGGAWHWESQCTHHSVTAAIRSLDSVAMSEALYQVDKSVSCAHPTAMSKISFNISAPSSTLTFHWTCCATTPGVLSKTVTVLGMNWFDDAELAGVTTPTCPDHHVVVGFGQYSAEVYCGHLAAPAGPEITIAELGHPTFRPLLLFPEQTRGKCSEYNRWFCGGMRGVPLGTCEAEVFVETPFTAAFAKGKGACVSVTGSQPTHVVKVSDEVKWRCGTNDACFAFQSDGSDVGPGSLFMEAVKASGGDGDCSVKTVSSWSAEAESVPLTLAVQDRGLPRATQEAYNATKVIELRSSEEVDSQLLFSCMPDAITSDAPVSWPPYVRCGIATMRLRDLTGAVGVRLGSKYKLHVLGLSIPALLAVSSVPVLQFCRYEGRKSKTSFLNRAIKKTCASLVKATSSNAGDASMTGMKLLTLLQGQKYFSTSMGDPQLPPFNQSGNTHPWLLGHGSLTRLGKITWGLNCPEGAIVTSSPTTQPHCLQVGAGAQTWIEVLSGSALCPSGSAVSGWYNLPGEPVQGNGAGGPAHFVGMRLFCRKTNLLANCQQLMNPSCQKGEVLAGIGYSSDSMRVKCCKLQQKVGLRLMPQEPQGRKEAQKDFQGYYCPTGIDSTGAPFYTRTLIRALGKLHESGANATLSWDKWTAEWQVRVNHTVVSSFRSDAVLPAEIDFSSGDKFSAVPIVPMPSFAKKPPPASPFPQHPPTFPKLLKFHPVQPDYKAYCDPTFLQNPALFSGRVEEGNPCYHTFNAEKPVQGLPKGITEEDFWQASGRSQTRQYLFAHAASEQNKLENWVQKEIGKPGLQDAADIAALVAAVATAIPWGSYSSPASAAKKVASKEGEKVAKKIVEKKVVQALISKAKAFASKVKGIASKSIKTASNAYAKAQKTVDAVKARYDKAKQTYNQVKGLPGQAQKKVQQGFGQVQSGVSTAEGDIADAESVINNYSPIKIPSELQLKKSGQKLQAKTLPQPAQPGGDSYANAESKSKADYADWMPLQYGLSKVMCDLFCIHNSVTAGTSAVLQSLQKSQEVLTTNIEQLLHYQTQYLLYKIGFLQPQTALELSEAPSTAELLEDSAEPGALQHRRRCVDPPPPKKNGQNKEGAEQESIKKGRYIEGGGRGTFIYIYIYTHIRTCVCVHLYVHDCACICMWWYMYTVHIHVYVYGCVCVYVHICVS
ncbi:unnamed protein product [Symbiodinium sp. CCMP2592]|nr:unnamed protein product [Symbiodinium sp. CCMP2592]